MGIILNLGCGPLDFEGEIGVDRYRTFAVKVMADIRHLPFKDSCADKVRLDHVLEHLPFRQAPTALLETARVLKPKGTMHIGIPDIWATCHAWLKADGIEEKAMLIRQIYGGQTHEGEYHLSGWDTETLKDLLQCVGFEVVKTRSDGEKDAWGASLIMEAVKA